LPAHSRAPAYACRSVFPRSRLACRWLCLPTIVEDNDLRRSGRLLIGQPLQGPETAVTIQGGRRGSGRTDGPFLETKEWLGGFTLIEAKDMAEAIALAKDSAIMKYASIEIRPTLEQTHSETGEGRPELKL
jgi:hypothetical protein